MFRAIVLALCVARFAVAQDVAVVASGSQVGPLPEGQLYANLGSLDQFAAGYGNGEGGKVERIDEPEQALETLQEVAPGQDQVYDHTFPDDARQNRVDNTKEINRYTVQQKVTTVNNRNLHRYLKNLLVNTIYNTNIAKINHSKLNNLLITQLQETHVPKLLVKYSRQDTTQDLGERSESPVINNAREDRVLPPIVQPASAEKIGYNGLPLMMANAGSVVSFGGRVLRIR